MNEADRIAANSTEVILGPNPIVGFQPLDVLRAAAKTAGLAATQPRLTARTARDIGREWLRVAAGESTLRPDPRDRRFADEAWMKQAPYRLWLQAWLAWVTGVDAWIHEQDQLSSVGRARLDFLAHLVNDTIAPSNFPVQPTAPRRFRETGGRSFRQGLRNLLRDLAENRGMPAQVDKSAFRVGENLATTEGSVVLRSELFELIQYRPRTEQVHAIPLLIVPPQINKYYVFDLSEEKSLVRGLLDAGYQVFIVSWRNPGPAQAEWGLAEYAAAIEMGLSVVCNITRQKKVNLLGACAGGITLAAAVAARMAVGDTRANSMTLLVNVLDTDALDDTALGLFAGPRSVEAAKQYSRRKGVLDGKDMAAALSWLRPNDLIWNYWINNVLLGRKPPALSTAAKCCIASAAPRWCSPATTIRWSASPTAGSSRTCCRWAGFRWSRAEGISS